MIYSSTTGPLVLRFPHALLLFGSIPPFFGAQTRSYESGGLREPVTSTRKSPPASIASRHLPTGDPCLRCFFLSGAELLFQCPYASLLIFNRVKNGIDHLHSNGSVFAESAHFPSFGFEFIAILKSWEKVPSGSYFWSEPSTWNLRLTHHFPAIVRCIHRPR